MITTTYGTIIDVSTTNLGSFLTVDALATAGPGSGGLEQGFTGGFNEVTGTAGATSLTVADITLFNESGGQLILNGTVYDYTGIDLDAGTVELTSPLIVDAFIDDWVELYPPYPVKRALVDLDVEESEAVLVTVPHDLSALLDDGMREEAQREVALLEERSIGELYLRDIIAQPATVSPEGLPPELEAVTSDGLPPVLSPNPVVQPMIGALHVKWEAIENHDLVTYLLYISDVDNFTPDESTLVAETTATTAVIRTLPNDLLLVYDTVYYIKIVTVDSDGTGPVGAQGSGTIMKATNADIAAEFIYAGAISASQISGGTMTGDVIVGGSLRTADSGARGELDAGGLTLYGPNGMPTTDLSTEGTSVFKGDAEISGLTVLNTMSIRGTANEISTGAELELAASTTAPSTAPTVVQTWDTQAFTKTGDSTFSPTKITSVTRLGTQWFCGYDDGLIYRFYLFNADGSFASEANDAYDSAHDNASTKITSTGRVYSIVQAVNAYLVRHRIDAADYTYTFQDDFTSGIDSSRWPTQVGSVSWDSGSGGRAKLVGDARLDTAWNKNFNDAFVSARMVRAGSYSGGQQMIMELYHTNNNECATIYTEGTQLIFKSWDPIANVQEGAGKNITYSTTSHAYWKIEEDAGVWRYYTSPDGVTWTHQHSNTHSLTGTDIDDLQIEFQGDENEPSTGTQTIYVDQVRFGPINEDLVIQWPRINTSQRPAIGNDGTNVLIAEYNATNNTFRISTVNPTTLAVISTVNTNSSSGLRGPLVGVLKGNFDFGSTRWILKANAGSDWWVFNATGTLQNAENFQADNGGSKWITWDGANFWALGTDGKLYKHTSAVPGATASFFPYCAAFTWYDSNTTGGTHETTISPVASFSIKQRAKITVTSPAIPPGGGVDNINSIRIYMGPTVTTLRLQSTTAAGVNSAVYNAITNTGAVPPTVGNFPGSTPAKIRNNSGSLLISGDGSIIANSVIFPTDTGWITTPISLIAVAATDWTITSAAVRRVWKHVHIYIFLQYTGSGITVPASGDIASTAVFQMVTAYRPGSGSTQGGLGSASTGRLINAVIVTDGTVSITAVGGSGNIATNELISVAGSYLML
jgi:hypothetical protein